MTKKKTVLSQPSWRIATPNVEAYVTETGGMIGPVTFDRRRKKIQPLSVAPWATEKLDRSTPPIIKALRGDFFCMPFGGNATPYRGERHPIHGETANGKWKLVEENSTRDRAELHLRLDTKIRRGRVDKFITITDQNVVYQRHVVTNMTGPMNFGHHAMLKFPDEPGSGVISTSRFILGQVFVKPTELPENRGYSILKPGAEFDSLQRVPTITGHSTDLSRYPARRGFEDIAMLIADPLLLFAWTAVAFPKQRYAWFALKDPKLLRGTILWISNGGRHYAPWNGRHVNVMGLEDITGYFHRGLAESAEANSIFDRGIPTHLVLRPDQPLTVNYIFGVAPLPAGFDRVASIERTARGIELFSPTGERATAAVDLGFLRETA